MADGYFQSFFSLCYFPSKLYESLHNITVARSGLGNQVDKAMKLDPGKIRQLSVKEVEVLNTRGFMMYSEIQRCTNTYGTHHAISSSKFWWGWWGWLLVPSWLFSYSSFTYDVSAGYSGVIYDDPADGDHETPFVDVQQQYSLGRFQSIRNRHQWVLLVPPVHTYMAQIICELLPKSCFVTSALTAVVASQTSLITQQVCEQQQ